MIKKENINEILKNFEKIGVKIDKSQIKSIKKDNLNYIIKIKGTIIIKENEFKL